MGQMRPSNYEIMRDRMEVEFAKHDQANMIQKFHLQHDADFLYIRFAAREYRINRKNGRVEWYSAAKAAYIHADYTVSMTLFDVLAWSRPDCRLDGHFVPVNELKGTTMSSSPAIGLFAKQAKLFTGHCNELRTACLKLGGKPGNIGDVSSTIPLFDFLPVVLQFWDADEEFEAYLKFMWDRNATDFMHFETVNFATMHLIDRLKETMEETR